MTTGSERRRLILPDDPTIKLVYGSDDPGRRAYLLRLRRAVKRGLLPSPTYLSAQRFGWWSDELEAALGRLPTSYAALPPPASVAQQHSTDADQKRVGPGRGREGHGRDSRGGA